MTAIHHRARGRIERLCLSTLDERPLRAEILTELKRAMDFDAYVWLLTDPVTTVGSAPLADVPCLPQLPRLIKLKYLTPLNRWTSLGQRQGPVGLLRQNTSGDPSLSLAWRELLRDLGVLDIASVVFADAYGCWGFLDLWIRGGRSFGTADADLLTDIAAPVCTALRRRQASAFAIADTEPDIDDGPAVMILDDGLRICSRTTAATKWLRSLLPTAADRAPIPAAALNVAAQLLAVEAGVDDHPAAARTFVPGRTWVSLRASRLEAQSGSGTIAVSIEETPAGPRLDLFGRSHGLSPREQELLVKLARGADTAEIAGQMSISEFTVQDHLKSIFAKTSVSGRGALITAALGPGDG